MKATHITYIFLIVILTSCAEDKKERIPLIDGLIDNYYGGKVLLFSNDDPITPLDTVKVNAGGSFLIDQESIEGPGFYYLEFNGNTKIDLFLKPNDYINLTFNADSISESRRSNNSRFTTALWTLQKNNKLFAKEMEKLTLEFEQMVGKAYNDSLYQQMYSKKDSIHDSYKRKSLTIAEEAHSPVIDFFMLNQKADNISIFSLKDDKKLFLSNAEKLSNNPQFETLFKQYTTDIKSAYSAMVEE